MKSESSIGNDLFRALFILSLIGVIAYSSYHFGEDAGRINCDTFYQTTCVPEEKSFQENLSLDGKFISTPTFNQLAIFCDKYSEEDVCKEFNLSKEKYG